MALSLADIRELFEKYGALAYSGEPVTQLEHALQSGALAEEDGVSEELIRLHVDAKRYLCAVDEAYFGCLSADSVRSLELQGGIFSADQARDFAARPYAEDAVRLRRWDDFAKVAGKPTPDLEHYLRLVERVMQRHA